MIPLHRDLIIYQGTYNKAWVYYSFDKNRPPDFQGAPKDLTDWTAKMQVRTGPDDDAVLLELTHEESTSGQIVLGGNTGIVQISIPWSKVKTLSFPQAAYDLFLFYDDVAIPFAEGSISIKKAITRV